MEDTEAHDPKKETLKEQYDNVKLKTKMSTVMIYGDISIQKDKVGSYQGNYDLS